MPTNELLRYWRGHRHLTLQELADSIGAPFKTVDNWEHRETTPSSKDLQKLTTLLGKSARELGFVRKNENPPIPYMKLDYLRDEFFTGREDILQRLYDELVQLRSKDTLYFIALVGMGGVGKTHIAIEYAHRHMFEYQTIIFLNASSKEDLTYEFSDLAFSLFNLAKRKEHGHEAAIRMVREWLGNFSRYLLIFDNVQDLSMIPDFLPLKIKGDVIVITQSQPTGSYAKPISVEPMGEEEGTYFLLRRSIGAENIAKETLLQEVPNSTIDLARELVDMLGGLPLALDQAGAYIEGTGYKDDLGKGLTHYIARYRRGRKALLEKRGYPPSPDHPASVMTTLTIALDEIRPANRLAINLLKLFAFFAPDNIPEFLFLRNPPVQRELGPRELSFLESYPTRFKNYKEYESYGDSMREKFENTVHDAIAALLRFSLIKPKADERVYSVHRLVQAALKDSMGKATKQRWITLAVEALGFHFVPGKRDWSGYNDLTLPHALECVETIKAEKLHNITGAVRLLFDCAVSHYDYQIAAQLYEEAIAFAREELGPEHSVTLIIQDSQRLFDLCKEMGEKYHATERMLRGELFRPRLKPADFLVVVKQPPEELRQWTTACYCRVDFHTARELGMSLPDFDWLGAPWPDRECLAILLTHLATYYSDAGEYTKAEPMLEWAIKLFNEVWGEEYISAADDLCDLAMLYRSQGKDEQAEVLYKQILEFKYIDQTSLIPIMQFYKNSGRYDLAEAALLRGLAQREQEIERQIVFALRTGEPMFDWHTDYAVSILGGLADLKEAQGRHEEAEQLLQRALTLLADKAERTGKEESLYDMWDDRWDRYEQSEPLLKRVFPVLERMWGPDHLKTAEALHNLAEHYYQHEKYEQAEPLMLRALAIREQAYGPEHLETAKSLRKLGLLYYAQGRCTDAEPLFQRALSIREQRLGIQHPDTASTLNDLASLNVKQGEYEQAESLYIRALAIREQVLGPEHFETGLSLHGLGCLYINLSKFKEAEPLLRRSLKIYEKTMGLEYPFAVLERVHLAGICAELGRYEEAETLYMSALPFYDRLPRGNGYKARSNYASLLRKLGREQEAVALERESG